MRVYAAMLPRLTAEESLLTAERVAVATGRVSEDDSRFLQRRWREAAGGSCRAGRAQQPTLGMLAMMGVGVVPPPARTGSDG